MNYPDIHGDFPVFHVDHYYFLESGIIKKITPDQYEWTKSKSSLALYFRKNVRADDSIIQGGFWQGIEKTFNLKRGTLARLYNLYNHPYSPRKYPRDYVDIINQLEIYREGLTEQKIIDLIKDLFL